VNTTDGYATVDEAAGIFRVDRATIIRWIRAGSLPATRTPGGRYRIVRADMRLVLAPVRRGAADEVRPAIVGNCASCGKPVTDPEVGGSDYGPVTARGRLWCFPCLERASRP
jgi:excisionase family DNA binding protein